MWHSGSQSLSLLHTVHRRGSWWEAGGRSCPWHSAMGSCSGSGCVCVCVGGRGPGGNGVNRLLNTLLTDTWREAAGSSLVFSQTGNTFTPPRLTVEKEGEEPLHEGNTRLKLSNMGKAKQAQHIQYHKKFNKSQMHDPQHVWGELLLNCCFCVCICVHHAESNNVLTLSVGSYSVLERNVLVRLIQPNAGSFNQVLAAQAE